ncbi:SDR family NAD(P)-dependent oxidoreductase [Enterovirga rhinocerotis]|uniref:NAD(P)-dependent dehydrogenase (Short-subunit alcohol dehydrogenase family) n=1 Tax=Enterovirga rhinocerotis TaxID=1339210 RepID=A0A4R7BUK3_9HYPH|nr:SDR family NAD(P)-dependent oxidoreductase [Enterovirga rhinocerotis]TDR89181.1 NAD(P)-dependent dehydrogenase (short-subunit alcohol dehydrogenase family) [Enterovirga rhinocerotis]
MSERRLLDGKVALVTGAGAHDGIGFATAKLFVEAGARVVLADIAEERTRELAAELGPDASAAPLDVRDAISCRSAVAATLARFGGLDILINSAGIVQTRKLADVAEADLSSVLDVNLRGTMRMAQAAAPAMTRGGSIVCIASIAAQRGGGLMGGPHYAASKGGVLGLVKAMARELGSAGIRVNAINPGVIMTGMNRGVFSEAQQEAMLATIPLGRFGSPRDVAGACLFLASDLSAYMTGTETDVNGGLLIH